MGRILKGFVALLFFYFFKQLLKQCLVPRSPTLYNGCETYHNRTVNAPFSRDCFIHRSVTIGFRFRIEGRRARNRLICSQHLRSRKYSLTEWAAAAAEPRGGAAPAAVAAAAANIFVYCLATHTGPSGERNHRVSQY